MSTSTAAVAPLRQLPSRLDHESWVTFLHQSVLPDGLWRPGEFDPARWLFTGDPDNPMTTSTRCRTIACATVVPSRCLCGPCRAALAASDVDEDEFVRTYQPSLALQRLTGEACVVTRAGDRCQRRSISHRSGLCQAHTSQWINSRDRVGLNLAEWAAQVARPLPGCPQCAVAGCHNDAKRAEVICRGHFLAWRARQSQAPAGPVEPAADWAARQRPLLAAHHFDLSLAAPTVRFELLYALQQRDAQGQRLNPQAVRGLVNAWSELDALATTSRAELLARIGNTRGYITYGRWVSRVIGLKFEEFRGVVHTDKDIWDCLALDLDTPRPGRRPNLAIIDFTPISQGWLRTAAKEWVRTLHPEPTMLRRTLQACTLASRALEARPGGGHDERQLRFADLNAVFVAINNATQGDGRLYSTRFRRGLWARFHAVIDLGRATDLLVDLPGTFSRHSAHSIAHEELNEDHIGKAVPETVIAQLDAHLNLLGADGNYGRIWSATDTTAMFAAAYQVLRDTGRRPGEVVSLRLDCLECEAGEYALVYDNHKKRRLRRRLPITLDTASIIQAWKAQRAGIDLPVCASDWLFPACHESSGAGHLTTTRLSQALRRWVDAIPELDSDLPGPDGTPAPFDRLAIYAYAFRHFVSPYLSCSDWPSVGP